MLSDWSDLLKLVWRNRFIRERIVVYCLLFPLVILMVMLFAGHLFPAETFSTTYTYALAFLTGFSYNAFITIFSIGMVYSYLKFLLVQRLLIKVLLLIYAVGLVSSLINSVAFLGLNFFNSIDYPFIQILTAFVVSNFILPALFILVASIDYAKIDLYQAKTRFFQPRSLQVLVVILSWSIFSFIIRLSNDLDINSGLIAFLILTVLLGISTRYLIKRVLLNCQNAITS